MAPSASIQAHLQFRPCLTELHTLLGRRILKRFPEPAVADNCGARWLAGDTYQLVDGAKRFEFYERNFAAQVQSALARSATQQDSKRIQGDLG